ncbi:MAG: hypothetical protein J6Q15_00395, partial [Clostridia bacterium]|nr:hypothetical protein [Clostridia bacterium]
LGSIVGSGTRSKIISCTSSVDYEVNSNLGSIGGLVGFINGYNGATDEDDNLINAYDGLISSSEYYGDMDITSTTSTVIGGIVGNAQYTRISDSSVMKKVVDDENNVTYETIQIEVNSVGNNYIGGIAGTYDKCSISYCSTDISISDLPDKVVAVAEDPAISDTSYYIGGIVGKIANQSVMDKDIDNSYSTLTYDLVKTTNAYIGGIVGEQASSVNVNFDTVFSKINIVSNAKGLDVGIDIVGRMVIGGIVGLTSGNPSTPTIYGTNINNSMAIINADADYNSILFGGGLIGQATGSYSIDNSTATGYIWANNSNGIHMSADSTPTLTVLGGLVGMADDVSDVEPTNKKISQKINNSYTTLTLSTAGVYVGEKEGKTHTVHTNGVVGYTHSGNKIEGSGILYSSDYTLALEEGNLNYGKFKSEPKNVTANLLINNNTTLASTDLELQDYDIGNSWIWAKDHLPLPLALKDILVNVGILYYPTEGETTVEFTSQQDGSQQDGKPYSPYIIDEDNFTDFDFSSNKDYSYYLWRLDATLSGYNDNLNG